MAINKKITTTKVVMWNGEEAAQVRGLSPNDISVILEREGENLRAVLDILDDLDIAGGDTDAIAGGLMSKGPEIVVKLGNVMPRFLATLVVQAANGDDEDIDDVAENWPLALMFLALTEIASLTFSGPEGFRAFVGNVAALGGLAKSLTGATNTGTAAPTPLENGSTTSSN